MAQPVLRRPLEELHENLGDEDEEVTPYEHDTLDTQMFCRDLIRMLQCTSCNRPFRSPITLACGHSFCRGCLTSPSSISAPTNLPRWKSWKVFDHDNSKEYRCPLPDCAWPRHKSLVMSEVDIQLANVVTSVEETLLSSSPSVETAPSNSENNPSEETLYIIPTYSSSSIDDGTFRRELLSFIKKSAIESAGGVVHPCDRLRPPPGDTRLGSLLRLASEGKLLASNEAYFYTDQPISKQSLQRNCALDRKVRASIMDEMACYICRSLVYRPSTTQCGHTFCRECLQRILDYQSPCPVCRHPLNIHGALEKYEINHQLNAITMFLFPREVERRLVQLAEEYHSGQVLDEIPLFVCAITYPSCPSYLHIFEPRYRLMMRRAYNGNRKFAMVNTTRSQSSQFGEDGSSGESVEALGKPSRAKTYMEYGTILEIQDRGWLVDGRSYIESVGQFKIRITKTREHDGYLMATYEKVTDLPREVELDLERREVESPEPINLTDPDGYGSLSFKDETIELFGAKYWNDLNHMTNDDLAAKVVTFARSWQMHRPLQVIRSHRFAFGSLPVDEPENLPYWFFHAIYSTQDDMYRVLRSQGVRERLKLAVIKVDMIRQDYRTAPFLSWFDTGPNPLRRFIGFICLLIALYLAKRL